MKDKVNKEIEKIQTRVKKQFPDAKCIRMSEGYFIYNKDENIFDEFFLPPANSIYEAWQYALRTVKTIQNFNRTHPLKLQLNADEEKLERILNRKSKKKMDRELYGL
tara:strand:- start:147 stop:467 length:321 start_codon:yes stop_codon:yes gene_type:complete